MAEGRIKLTDEVKAFIVQQLACFDTPTQVAGQVKEEFGVEVSPQLVQAYDPTKHAGKGLSEKWRVEFWKAREAFKSDIDSLPIASRSYRLRRLQKMADRAEQMRNLPLAAQLLEQAAKEVGEAFSNKHKHELTGKDGKPIEMAVRTVKRVIVDPENPEG